MTPSDLFRRKIRTSSSDALIPRYYQGIQLASERIGEPSDAGFAPPFEYPELTDTWEEFFSVARASWHELGAYRDKRLALLDLMKNPATRTTKSTASLLMVARAVRHIRTTGEAIMIFTPSSGNKASALRDAVARALELGLAMPDELRIATLTPIDTLYKFRQNLLTESAELRQLNPFMVYPGTDRAAVKGLGRDFVNRAELAGSRPCRLWYSLDIANYKVADACRAFYEFEFAPPAEAKRAHAHAVSSAYGLLGYQHGLNVLGDVGLSAAAPGFILVQHLATSDMVAHFLRTGLGIDPSVRYEVEPGAGLLRQDDSPHFPHRTWSEAEDLEPTFYTKNPPTAPEMTSLMVANGGTGVVVSLHECLARYGEVRDLLATTKCTPPADPRDLAEWSLSMAGTGVLNAIDRGLADSFGEIVVHGSGMYQQPADNGISLDQVYAVSTTDDMLNAVNRPLLATQRPELAVVGPNR